MTNDKTQIHLTGEVWPDAIAGMRRGIWVKIALRLLRISV